MEGIDMVRTVFAGVLAAALFAGPVMAGLIGSGNRFDYTVIWIVVITLVILVQAIQAIGNAIAKKVMH